MTALRVLVAKMGTTHPRVITTHGDYEAWFRARLGADGLRVDTVDAYQGVAPPEPSAFDGVILTGSPQSVRAEAPWMSVWGQWALRAARRRPVLGVCFGHQLTGEALGGRVEANPLGREGGAIQVQLTLDGEADPLFAGLPGQVRVHATHSDILVTPPLRGATRLAGNTNTHWQAFRWGPHLRCVQFHPEVDAAIMDSLMVAYDAERSAHHTDHGARILRNWRSAFLGPGARAGAGAAGRAPG